MELAADSAYDRLVGTVEQLAKVQAAWEAGEVAYPELRAAFDAVAAAKAEAGVDVKLELVG